MPSYLFFKIGDRLVLIIMSVKIKQINKNNQGNHAFNEG